ncbi:MAG: SGNH/GDSL hydrolase family protein [Polyangiales bacterium]
MTPSSIRHLLIAALFPLAAASCSGASSGSSGALPGDTSNGDDTANGVDGSETATADDTAVETNAMADGVSDAQATSDVTDAIDAPTPVYNPCPPAGSPCLIMPFGDSITWGSLSSTGGGYRIEMLRKAWAAKKSINFVGSVNNGPAMLDGKPFPRANEGHSGYTIDDAPAVGRLGISQFIPGSLTTYKPHIVLLMIGTNDVNTGNDLANAPTRLANLVDKITAAAPDVLLVVAQIVPSKSPTLNTKIMAYNAPIPAMVKARAAAGKHVLLVDMYGAMTADPAYATKYYNDTLHPNDAGFVVMASVWDDAVGGLFR